MTRSRPRPGRRGTSRTPSAVRRSKSMRRVDAALAEVPVGRAAQAVLVEQLAQVAQVVRRRCAGRDRRVLPARPVVVAVGRERGRAQAALADLPDLAAVAALLLAAPSTRIRSRGRPSPRAASARSRRAASDSSALSAPNCTSSHASPWSASGSSSIAFDVLAPLLLVPDQPLVEALQPDRPEPVDDLADVARPRPAGRRTRR